VSDPAHYERDRVREWRAKGRSWNCIAENLRKCPEDVRRLYDHDYLVAAPVVVVMVPRPEPKPVVKQGPAKGEPTAKQAAHHRKQELDLLARFYHSAERIRARDFTHAEARAWKRLWLTHRGKIHNYERGLGHAITPYGRRLYERLVQGKAVK
jgi:hypothetical protein